MASCVGPVGVIKSIYLFHGLDEKQMEKMLASAQCRDLNVGERLFSHGDSASHFFWLCAGLVKLTRLSPEGDEKVIEVVQPNKTFAEAVMFMDKGRYPVNAEAIENSKIIAFNGNDFKEVLRESPDTCFKLLANLSMHLHSHVDEIDRLTLSNAMTRLVAYLLQLPTEEDEINLSISKNLLASRLSIKPETLSRLFSKLQKEGLITVHGHSISVHDMNALREYVDLPEH